MSKKIGKIRIDLEKVKKIRFLVLDVDGVMTDGKVTYGANGEEFKSFNIKDGQGLKFWSRVGYGAGIITGRTSPIVERRAAELDIAHVVMDAKDKLPEFRKMLAAAGVSPDEVAMIGDDMPDVPLLRHAGLGTAVADAVQEVKEAADIVTNKKGGRGAVRELIEFILKTQGRWTSVLERYYEA